MILVEKRRLFPAATTLIVCLCLCVALFPLRLQGYKHEAAEVRKAVVFALVEVYLVMGEDLQPHLEPLSPSQLKLLRIYVKRSQDRLGASVV